MDRHSQRRMAQHMSPATNLLDPIRSRPPSTYRFDGVDAINASLSKSIEWPIVALQVHVGDVFEV